MDKNKLLILVDWFEPGFKGGGQIRSVSNIVRLLKGDAQIYILTGDRDLGDTTPYKQITSDQWVERNGYRVWYASHGSRRYRLLLHIIRSVNPDCIYVNGIFSWSSSILPLIVRKFSGIANRIVVAPRGMLKPSAARQKGLKKSVYLKLLSASGITKHISFHATDEQEENDIRARFGLASKVTVISNVPAAVPDFTGIDKQPGELKLVFTGRVHPVKNLLFLLQLLLKIKGLIQLTIITSELDTAYWKICQQQMTELPDNISVVIKENVPHHAIHDLLLKAHALALPTLGENFGHAIFESFAAGRPVIISDQTPWKDLEQRSVGWDIPLNSPAKFIEKLQILADMEGTSFNTMCMNAWNYAKERTDATDLKHKYLGCFFG